MKENQAVNGDLSVIIKKGGDDLHDMEAAKEWNTTSKAATPANHRTRSGGKRKAKAQVFNNEELSDDEDQHLTRDRGSDRPKPKRLGQAK
jgi:hypothetical protein